MHEGVRWGDSSLRSEQVPGSLGLLLALEQPGSNEDGGEAEEALELQGEHGEHGTEKEIERVSEREDG